MNQIKRLEVKAISGLTPPKPRKKIEEYSLTPISLKKLNEGTIDFAKNTSETYGNQCSGELSSVNRYKIITNWSEKTKYLIAPNTRMNRKSFIL